MARPDKFDHLTTMLTQAQNHISKMQAKLNSGELTPEQIKECEDTIAAMTAKIERLSTEKPSKKESSTT